MVVSGSLVVFRNAQFTRQASEGENYDHWYRDTFLAGGDTSGAVRYGELIDTCGAGISCGDVSKFSCLLVKWIHVLKYGTTLYFAGCAHWTHIPHNHDNVSNSNRYAWYCCLFPCPSDCVYQ